MTRTNVRDDPKVTAFWDTLDNYARKKGILYGIPLGIGEVPITTTCPGLARIIKQLDNDGSSNALRTPEEEELLPLEDSNGERWTIRRSWYTQRQWRGQHGVVVVLENSKTRHVKKMFMPRSSLEVRLKMLFETGGIRTCYSLVEAEQKAQERLMETLSPLQQKQYFLTDAFAEQGQSGVMYFLRKNRPTLATRLKSDGSGNVLCALCLHPLAYYTDTWAGVTPPSDEVLTHLLLIRNDEHHYWRTANQLPLDDPVSGI